MHNIAIKDTYSDIVTRNKLEVVTYNCKNITTSAFAVNDFFQDSDIVLPQEHWLFQSQISLLDEVSDKIQSADFGEVEILRKAELDPSIKVFEHGGNRIRCIQIDNFIEQKGLVLVSVYLQCRGLSGNMDEFCDCIDQLREICLK